MAQNNRDDEVVKQIKCIVPEYVSNNPIYLIMQDDKSFIPVSSIG
jgi:hypothetical protein